MPQNFCKITTLDLSYVVQVKSTVEISQNFVAFSGYMNFRRSLRIFHSIERLENTLIAIVKSLVHMNLNETNSKRLWP